MFASPEQLSKATKESLDAQMAAMNELATKALHSVAALVELNITTAKDSLAHTQAAAQQMLSAKDGQDLMNLSSSQAQPGAEKALAYARHAAAIVTKAQAEFTKSTEARINETTKQINKLIDELSKTAPTGSEQAIALLKTSIANANAAIEQMVKGSKQAMSTMENSLDEVTSQFTAAKPARSKK
jgi:phasin family protein